MTIDELLETFRADSASEYEKGARFERLMKNFLLSYPPYLGQIASVKLWKNFSNERDLGIDLVAETVDGNHWAVQCKFYAETAAVDKPDVDSFISNSGRTFNGISFASRIFIATTNNFTDNASKMLDDQTPPVRKITLETLRNARVDWEKIRDGQFGETVIKKNSPRPYQREAIDAARLHFQTESRGKLIMACGTGKTFTALKIAEELTNGRGLILFLVPSLSLVKQTLEAWTADAQNPLRYICVCSDETVTRGVEDSIRNVDLPVSVTNDPAAIAQNLQKIRRNATGLTVVFSTYQSLDRVAEAQKTFDAPFDLAICDEAHRTAGNTAKDKDAKLFALIHDETAIRARRRIYMTATPKLYNEATKAAAARDDRTVWSMDDEKIFGREFYHISFKRAIELGCLSDYEIMIFAVSEGEVKQSLRDAIFQKYEQSFKDLKVSFSVDDAAKLIGCINALSKRVTEKSRHLIADDATPMHKAVAFFPKINDSKANAAILSDIQEIYAESLSPAERAKIIALDYVHHVDGKMNASDRAKALENLKAAPTDGNVCRIITNVRCLSEGVDVPSLDAVIFLTPKKSPVDIVQAVGRALRKAAGKKRGYIVVPIVAPVINAGQARDYFAANNQKYDTVWRVVNALKAHDESISVEVERLASSGKSPKIHPAHSPDFEQYSLPFEIFQTELLAQVVEHAGNRYYWLEWADKIAAIVERHVRQIAQILASGGDARTAFNSFLADLHKNINPTITEADAIDMLAQHLVSRPVFEALFDNYSFASQNPVSKSMSAVIAQLDKSGLAKDRAELDKFYREVREGCRDMGSAQNRQRIISNLYDNFFKQALPKTVQQLGIVYTPPEVVDFILHSVSAALEKFFHRNISDRNVHVLEPFAGTGTFLARLIQSGLIHSADLKRKYQSELHANEIVLLAYYIAAVNIENAFHAATNSATYAPFSGICLTDTFQTYEIDEAKKARAKNRQGTLIESYDAPLKENFGRIQQQLDTEIEIIIGNPPYSVGQKSANDNAQNVHYDHLEHRIAETYAAKTAATNKNSLYDSYIKAFRWASDRISNGGIVGFVTNAGWLDGAAMDGLRECFEQDFTEIYIFNLRGNARTQGEIRRKEAGNIFESGSRAPIAITILVKVPNHTGAATIHYCDIGDYLSREDKLSRIAELKSAFSPAFRANEIIIRPNPRHDWINQRGDAFDGFIILGDKKDKANRRTIFSAYSSGVETKRDAWTYNFSRAEVAENMAAMIDFYNSATVEDRDPKKISWTRSMVKNKNRGREFEFAADKIVEAMYRPFCKQYLYFDRLLNEEVFQVHKIFPTGIDQNLLICVPGTSGNKNFSVLITDKISDYSFNDAAQCFPLYWYSRSKQTNLFEEEYERRDGVTDWSLEQARRCYGGWVSKEDVFYYVYGFLHMPAYRAEFAAELKKSLPRIFFVESAADFGALVAAGRALAALHLNYEAQAPTAGVVVVGEAAADYRVRKLKLVRSGETLTLVYNSAVRLEGIPARALEYVVNGRSPLEWLVERYQVKTDKASGIVNDPNLWCAERGEPAYILRLAESLVTVSLKTLEIVAGLPEIKF